MSVFNSGNWLMTAKRRAKEGILQAVGAHQATEDLEFDQRLKNFNTHVSELNKIKEAMDLWIESFDTFCAASQILGESFKNFFATSPFKSGEEISHSVSQYANISAAFDKVMADVSQTVQPAIRETFVNRCLKPTISILSLVPAINEQVQERKTIMLDFDSYKAKIQKEHAAGRDSAHPNVVKKAIKLDDSAKKLYAVQQSIVSSIEEYEAARPIMLGAEFASFIACYYQQSYYASDLTSKLLPIVPQSSSSLNIMDAYIQQHNKQKYSLSLVNNDRVLSGGFAPSNTSFQSTQFLCELKARHACTVIEPILTRTEYLGGSYGGYNTGGDYMRPVNISEDEEDDIRQATAQLVPVSSSGTSDAVNNGSNLSHLSVSAPLVDAVVIDGELTEATSPASLVSGHSSSASNSTTPGSIHSRPFAVSSDGFPMKPPPPPRAPRNALQTTPINHETSQEIVIEGIETTEVSVNITTTTATTTTTTTNTEMFLTAIDATVLDDGNLEPEETFMTPLAGPPTSLPSFLERVVSTGPPKPPRGPPPPPSSPPSSPPAASTNPFDE